MYVPAHFAGEDEAVQELLYSRGAADLVTATPEGLVATMLPFLYDRERSVLLGHLARNNEHWKLPVIGDALVIMRGPDAYISPTWYASKQEHGRVVPTWNYSAVHLSGTVELVDDTDRLRELVDRLTDLHEHDRPARWSVDDAPAAYVAGQLKAIRGVLVRVDAVQGKAKLSQNRSVQDRAGVVDGLLADGDPEGVRVADAMARLGVDEA